jgi:hypothetical protein
MQTYIHTKLCASMFTATLLVIANIETNQMFNNVVLDRNKGEWE